MLQRNHKKVELPKLVSRDSDYDFRGQKADEEVIVHLKRHPMTMYHFGQLLVLLAVIVVASYVLWGASLFSSVLLCLYLLIGGYYAFRAWYLWHNSHYILTNRRVIAVDQTGFFQHSVNEAPLDKIQNVTYNIKGAYQTFLDFGTINIKTDGERQAWVDFVAIPHPYDVQQEIEEATHKFGNVVVEADELEEKKQTILR